MPRGRRTQYVRDNSGRFSSTPGGGPSKATPSAVRKAAKAAAMKGGSLAARTSLKKSKAKLTTSPSPQQKGAVTRSQKSARAAIKASKTQLKTGAKSKLRKGLAASLLTIAKNRAKAKPAKAESAAKAKNVNDKTIASKIAAAIKRGPITSKSKTTAPSPPPKKSSNDGLASFKPKEYVNKPGYKIPKPPANYQATSKAKETPKKVESKSQKRLTESQAKARRVESRIFKTRERAIRSGASFDKQWKSFKTQQRAEEFLQAARKFAKRKGISLEQALRSGPKNSTRKKSQARAKRIESRIFKTRERAIRSGASFDKQWKSFKTQQRAEEFLKAAGKFAKQKGITLEKALRSGPKSSTAKNKRKNKA